MRCVTFNIKHGAFGLQRVGALLRDLAADLVFLQEVDRGCRRSGGTDQALFVAEALGFHHAFAEAMPFDGGSYGLAILCRRPLLRVETQPLPHRGPPQPDGRGEPRIVLSAEVAGLVVACTHLGLDDAERMEQAEFLTRSLQNRGRPVLLGGDFNEGPHQPAVRICEAWLSDALTEARGQDGQTAPGDRPRTRIDFIFRSSGAPKPLGAFVGPGGYSDHNPVIVDFEAWPSNAE